MLGLIRLAWAERTRVAVHPEAEHRRVPRSVVLLAGGPPRDRFPGVTRPRRVPRLPTHE